MYLKVAVIGVGMMGKNHARIYNELKGVKLVAVCDQDENIGREIANFYNIKFYNNHKELLEKERLDAVSIVVPTKYHKEVALDFIKKGINVLIEKPLAINEKDARLIYEQAKINNVILSVGHIERYNPAIIKLHKLVKSGFFGDILSIVVKRVGLFPPRIKDVNVVIDLGVHDLDVISSIVEKNPKSIYATGGSGLLQNSKIEDHSEIFLDFESFGCFIQVNWVTPIKIRTLSITGTKGYAEVNYISQQIELYKSIYKIVPSEGFNDFVLKFGNPKKINIQVKNSEPLKVELQSFIKSVKSKQPPMVSGEEAIRAVKMANLVNKSITSKKVIAYK